MRFARTIGCAAAVAAIAGPAAAQGSGWTPVGRAMVAPDAASGTIEVRWQRAFREAMLCVDGHGIRLAAATFRFEDGTTKVVKLRQALADGGCSKPFSMPRKTVSSADIGYDPASLGGAKAKVQLTAR